MPVPQENSLFVEQASCLFIKSLLRTVQHLSDTQQILKLFYDTVPLEDAIAKYTAVEPPSTLVKMTRDLGICLGD